MLRVQARYNGIQSRQFCKCTNWAKTLIRNHKELQRYRTFSECCTILIAIVFLAKLYQSDYEDVNQHKVQFDDRIYKVGLFYLTCRVQVGSTCIFT